MIKSIALLTTLLLSYDYLPTNVPIKLQCKPGMVFVSGEYCTDVKQECSEWLDPPETDFARCKVYKPSVCIGKKIHQEFCIDVDEYTDPTETLPKVNVSFYRAQQICESEEKRLCKETEWEFACEGEQMFPHTTGLVRSGMRTLQLCNFDIEHDLGSVGHLKDHRIQSSSLTSCVSPFGVRNMNGNVDELVIRNRTPGPYTSGLKGGWWGALRNRCRPATVAHGEEYSDAQVGFRCCSK